MTTSIHPGVPTDRLGRIFPNHVIDMLLHVRERRTCVDAFASPLLVHCSAGVGRTGTFIVIDHVISAIARQQKVDIIDIVKRCREDRMAIVQHTIQYKFAYQACINYAESVLEKNDGEIFALASPKVGADSIYEATTGLVTVILIVPVSLHYNILFRYSFSVGMWVYLCHFEIT